MEMNSKNMQVSMQILTNYRSSCSYKMEWLFYKFLQKISRKAIMVESFFSIVRGFAILSKRDSNADCFRENFPKFSEEIFFM